MRPLEIIASGSPPLSAHFSSIPATPPPAQASSLLRRLPSSNLQTREPDKADVHWLFGLFQEHTVDSKINRSVAKKQKALLVGVEAAERPNKQQEIFLSRKKKKPKEDNGEMAGSEVRRQICFCIRLRLYTE